MADYHSPTVIVPPIPATDITPLEHFLLPLIFDETIEDDGSYFHSWCGPSEVLTVESEPLRAALAESADRTGPVDALVASLLAQHDAEEDDKPDDIDIDLTRPGAGWPEMLQAIVRRSQTIDEIIATSAFTCTKMRPDGFGGSVMRITAEAIQYASTTDMLERMRDEQPPPSVSANGGHETRCRLENIAAAAGWDSFTLLLLIAAWLDRTGQTEQLLTVLDTLAGEE